MMNKATTYGMILLLALSLTFARPQAVNAKTVEINLAHLEKLQQHYNVEGIPCTGVAIYCEAPDYHMVADDDEGAACVDDVARAARVYLEVYRQDAFSLNIEPLREMLRFVLALQAPDGEFWNFVWDDGSINRVHRTSQKSLDWWAARGFRALAMAQVTLPRQDDQLSRDIEAATERTVTRLLEVHGDTLDTEHFGYDRTAEWMLGLLEWRKATGSDRADMLIQKYGDYLASSYWTPPANTDGFPYPLHRSWQNVWHAWGSLQVEALARAGEVFNRPGWISQAVLEGSGFQRWLMADGMWNELHFSETDTIKSLQFAQIAYGVGSIVACQNALYEVTGDTAFAYGAGLAATWFSGNNPTGLPMYDPETGRGYDGIVSAEKRNLNAGAESTIEALLALVLVQQSKPASLAFHTKVTDGEPSFWKTFSIENETITLRRADSCWNLSVEENRLNTENK